MTFLQALNQNILSSFWPRIFQRNRILPTFAVSQYWILSKQNGIRNFRVFAACSSKVAQKSVESASQECNFAITKLKSEISSKTLKFETLKKATVPGLSENNATFLISLCGKPLGISKANVSLRNEHAKNIFEAASTKTATLFNSVLQVYVENGNMVDSSLVLSEMKKLKLEPNKDTYAKLIALHCLKGDVEGAKAILELAKQCKFDLPDEIHGDLAYGLCISGLPRDGLNYIGQQIMLGSALSWDKLTSLLIGLAKVKSFDLYRTAIHKYAPCCTTTCSIDNVLDVYFHLIKFKSGDEIVPMLKHLIVSKDDIVYASRFVKDYFVSLKDSAYLMKLLFEQYNSSFELSENTIAPAKIILKDIVGSCTTVDKIYDHMKTIVLFYPKSQIVEILTLLEIALSRPLLMKSFLKKLFEKQVIMKPPSDSIKTVVNNEELLESIVNVHALLNEDSSLKIPLQKLELALSLKNLDPSSEEILEVFGSTADISRNSLNNDTILKTLILFLEKNGVNNWKLSRFQALMRLLHANGLKVNQRDIEKVHLLIGAEADFLFDSEISDKAPMKQKSRHKWNNIKPPKKLPFTPRIKQLNTECCFDLHAAAHSLSDFVIDEHFKKPDRFFATLKIYRNFSLFHDQVLPAVNNLIFCVFLEHGMVKEAETLVTKKVVDLNIQLLPLSFLKSVNKSTMKFLIQHLVEKQGHENAIWIMFTSLVKANMIAEAQKVINEAFKLNVNEGAWLNFLTVLSDETDFIEKVKIVGFLCQDLQNFNRDKLYVTAINLLLKNKKIDEAKNWINDSWAQLGWGVKGKVARLFYKINEIPPSNVLPWHHKLFLKSVAQKDIQIEEVLSNLRNMQSNYPVLWKAALRTLLAKLYRNIPVDEFSNTTKQIQAILPTFNPSFVSTILIDQVQKLAKNVSVDKALQFAIENLQESTEENCETWSSIVRICCDVAIANVDFLALERICNFSLHAIPEVKAIATSYIIYSRLKSNEVVTELLESPDVPKCLGELIKLIEKKKDTKALSQFFNILSSSHVEHMDQFLSSTLLFYSDFKHVRKMFEKHQPSINTLNKIADLCYSSAADYKEYQKIDTFFRSFYETSTEWQANLNTKLFSKFCSTFHESNLDNEMVDYLVQNYHKVSSRHNSLYTRTVYLDLLTNAKYSTATDNKLCVYS